MWWSQNETWNSSHNLCLIDIQQRVRLNSGCCRCWWHLKLTHLNLLLKRGDHRHPPLKLKVLLLVGVLEVYNHVTVLIHQLMRRVKLLMNVVPRVLGLAKLTVCDLQLSVLVWRGNCTTMEKVILTLQLHELTCGNEVVLVIRSDTQALLDDRLSSVVLQVERVLWVLGVGYGLKVLLPHRVSPIANRKEHHWHCRGVTKAAPT
jgi:hypothetical protein